MEGEKEEGGGPSTMCIQMKSNLPTRSESEPRVCTCWTFFGLGRRTLTFLTLHLIVFHRYNADKKHQ